MAVANYVGDRGKGGGVVVVFIKDIGKTETGRWNDLKVCQKLMCILNPRHWFDVVDATS